LVTVTLDATPTYPAGGETNEIPASQFFVDSTILSRPAYDMVQ